MGLWISEVMGFKFLGVVVVERYVVKVIGFKFWFIVVVERYIIEIFWWKFWIIVVYIVLSWFVFFEDFWLVDVGFKFIIILRWKFVFLRILVFGYIWRIFVKNGYF